MATISGEVRDENNDLLADCVVRAYRRDTGALLVEGITGDGTEEVPGDVDYASVSLLLHCEGVNGSTTFTDNSPIGHTVTANGNAQISTAQFNFGTASAVFDSDADRLTIPHHASLSLAAGDFTVECGARFNVVNVEQNLLGKQATLATATGYFLKLLNTGAIAFKGGDSTPGWNVEISGGSLSPNTWYHVAATRSGNSWRLFLNGTQVGSTVTASLTLHDASQSLFIGTNTDGSTYDVSGYLDEIRITKGRARYTENFTPPAVAFFDNVYVPAKPLGEYSLTTAYTDEVQVIALDPAGGTTFNDMILRTTPV